MVQENGKDIPENATKT